MAMKKPNRGFTLIEMIVYLSISLIIIIFAGNFIINGLRYYRLVEIETRLQQDLIVSISNISKEINMAKNSSLIKGTNGVIFASARKPSGSFSFSSVGELYWQKWVCIYMKQSGDTNIIVKKEIAISPETLSPGAPPFATVSEFDAAAVPERIIARGATAFTVEDAGYPGGYKISISLDKTTDTTRPNEIRGETEVLLRN